MKPAGLGRGLASLIPVKKAETPVAEVMLAEKSQPIDPVPEGDTMRIPVDLIDRNPEQPRKEFSETEMQELTQSIKEYGILQPLLVSKTGARFTLIAGERRLRAARRAGLTEVPCLIHRETTDKEQLQLAIIENVQRENLNAIDQALAFKKLHDEFGLSYFEIADQVGKERPTISNAIRILNLPEEIQQAVRDNKINFRTARELLKAETPKQQMKMFRKALAGKMSSYAIEHRSKRTNVHGYQRVTQKDPELGRYEDEMARVMGTKVRIKSFGESGGNVIIDYFSREELLGIIEKIVKE